MIDGRMEAFTISPSVKRVVKNMNIGGHTGQETSNNFIQTQQYPREIIPGKFLPTVTRRSKYWPTMFVCFFSSFQDDLK